jgi:hypothetical protein
MKKGLGYGLVVLGAIAIALSYAYIRTLIGIPTLPAPITDLYLIIGGIILIILGGLVVSKGSFGSPKHVEVPIYHGNKIVGYRRHAS